MEFVNETSRIRRSHDLNNSVQELIGWGKSFLVLIRCHSIPISFGIISNRPALYLIQETQSFQAILDFRFRESDSALGFFQSLLKFFFLNAIFLDLIEKSPVAYLE